MKLSVIVLTKNSESSLEKTLKSVLFSDEIIVVDDDSGDTTVKIAKEFKARVFKRSLGGDFSAQRNFGLKKAKGEWVFFVDSDEEVPVALKNEIIQAINNPLKNYSTFRIKRRDIFEGEMVKTTEGGKMKLIRIAKKGSGVWHRQVHEVWKVKGKVWDLKSYLIHSPHRNLGEYLGAVNYYSTLHALSNFKEGKKSSVAKIFLFPILKFIKNWIILGGVGQGRVGFTISFMMSVHSFLAWSKLWFLQKK